VSEKNKRDSLRLSRFRNSSKAQRVKAYKSYKPIGKKFFFRVTLVRERGVKGGVSQRTNFIILRVCDRKVRCIWNFGSPSFIITVQ